MESSSIWQGGHGDLVVGVPGKASTATRIKPPYPPEFGEEAVRLCEQERPDVVVIDLAMPVLDGLQAIPRIRAGSPDASVVVLSGFARGFLDEEALSAGASAYVEKGEAFSTIVPTLVDVAATKV